MATIDSLSRSYGTTVYQDPKFCRFVEIYLDYLKNSSASVIRPIDSHSLYKYEGDFYGLLDSMGISGNLHWITLRMNDLTNPIYTTDTLKFILVPSQSTLDLLVQYHNQLK